ncbi:hypothetical protein HC928_24295 [bacterium]|nr:hypothetical protein [bacterium]
MINIQQVLTRDRHLRKRVLPFSSVAIALAEIDEAIAQRAEGIRKPIPYPQNLSPVVP